MLPGNPAFRTTDPDLAGRHLSPYLCRHKVNTLDDRRLLFNHCHSDIGDIGIHLLSYGVDLTVSGNLEDEFYILLLLLEGWGELTQGKLHSIACPGNVCVINPNRELSLFLTADQMNMTLRVPRRLVDDFVSRETGTVLSAPLQFLPPSRHGGSGIRNFMSYVCGELCRDGTSLTSRLVNRQVEQTLVGLMLTELPHDQMDLLAKNAIPPSPAYIRMAEEFIKVHVRDAISVRDIAQAAGISMRTLQKGFRQYYGTTPTAALRNHRLLLAREKLLRANPHDHSVTEIALDCGFTHLSKFAGRFKARFGECPSETLKRTNLV